MSVDRHVRENDGTHQSYYKLHQWRVYPVHTTPLLFYNSDSPIENVEQSGRDAFHHGNCITVSNYYYCGTRPWFPGDL